MSNWLQKLTSSSEITILSSVAIIHFSNKWEYDIALPQERAFSFFFVHKMKNTDPSLQIEMNWQLNCFSPSNHSLIVSYVLLIPLTTSLVHSNSLLSSCSLCKSISHYLLHLENWDAIKKTPLIRKVMKRLPNGLKPTPREEPKIPAS